MFHDCVASLFNPLSVDYFVWLVSCAIFNADMSIVFFVVVLFLLLQSCVKRKNIRRPFLLCHDHQIISVGHFYFWYWNRVFILRHILFQSSNDGLCLVWFCFQPFVFIDLDRYRFCWGRKNCHWWTSLSMWIKRLKNEVHSIRVLRFSKWWNAVCSIHKRNQVKLKRTVEMT